MYESCEHVNSGNRVHYCRSLGGVPLDAAYSRTQAPLEAVDNMVLGIALALAADVDLYSAAGVTFAVPYLGNVLTGIVFSRGSNYFADFVSKLTTK